MKVEQFVMAYGVEHDRLRAILPEGFSSLRPVLRINAEICDDKMGYLEFNTAAEQGGKRGWLNIAHFENMQYVRAGKTVRFENALLKIAFTPVGIEGGCPAEKDNDGCCFPDRGYDWRPPEIISANKEFCDCAFLWKMQGGAQGKSIGKTLPAVPTEIMHIYPKAACTVENAAIISCDQVLGTYMVRFER